MWAKTVDHDSPPGHSGRKESRAAVSERRREARREEAGGCVTCAEAIRNDYTDEARDSLRRQEPVELLLEDADRRLLNKHGRASCTRKPRARGG